MSTSYRYPVQSHQNSSPSPLKNSTLTPFDKRYLKSYLDNLSDSNRKYQDPNKSPTHSMIVEDNLDRFIQKIDQERQDYLKNLNKSRIHFDNLNYTMRDFEKQPVLQTSSRLDRIEHKVDILADKLISKARDYGRSDLESKHVNLSKYSESEKSRILERSKNSRSTSKRTLKNSNAKKSENKGDDVSEFSLDESLERKIKKMTQNTPQPSLKSSHAPSKHTQLSSKPVYSKRGAKDLSSSEKMLLQFQTYQSSELIEESGNEDNQSDRQNSYDVNNIGFGISQTDLGAQSSYSRHHKSPYVSKKTKKQGLSQSSSGMINQHFSPEFRNFIDPEMSEDSKNPKTFKPQLTREEYEIQKQINQKYHQFMKQEKERHINQSQRVKQQPVNVESVPKLDIKPNTSASKPPIVPTKEKEKEKESHFEERQDDKLTSQEKTEVIHLLKSKYQKLKVQNEELFNSQMVQSRQIDGFNQREAQTQKKYKRLKEKMHEILDEYHDLKKINQQLQSQIKQSSNYQSGHLQDLDSQEFLSHSKKEKKSSPKKNQLVHKINVFGYGDNPDTFRDTTKDNLLNFDTFSLTEKSLSPSNLKLLSRDTNKQEEVIRTLKNNNQELQIQKIQIEEKLGNQIGKYEDLLANFQLQVSKTKALEGNLEDVRAECGKLEGQNSLKNKQLDEARKDLKYTQQNDEFQILKNKLDGMNLEIDKLTKEKLEEFKLRKKLENNIIELKFELDQSKSDHIRVLDLSGAQDFYKYVPDVSVKSSQNVSSFFYQDDPETDPNSMLTTQLEQQMNTNFEEKLQKQLAAQEKTFNVKIQDLGEQNRDLNVKVKTLMQKVDQLSKEKEKNFQDHQKELSILGSKLDVSLNESKGAKEETERLKKLTITVDALKKENSDLKTKYDQSTEEYKKLDLAFASMSTNLQTQTTNSAKKDPSNINISELESQLQETKTKLEDETKLRTSQANEYLEKINNLTSKVCSVQERKKRFEDLRSKKESELSVDEIAELDLTKYVYKVERLNKQLKADMVSIEKENDKKLKKLLAQIEKFKIDTGDKDLLDTSQDTPGQLDKIKQSVISKNKLIGELRAELEIVNGKLEQLSQVQEGQAQSGGNSKEYQGKPDDLPLKLTNLLKEVKLKPDEDSQESVNAQVVSYITHKNSILEQRLREFKETQKEMDKSKSGIGMSVEGTQQLGDLQKQLQEAQDEALGCQMKMSQQIMMVGELNDKLMVYANLLKKNKIALPK